VSTGVTVSDTSKLHVYAAERSSDHAVTILVINKTNADLTSALSLSNHTVTGAAHLFSFSQAQPKAISPQPDLAITDPGNFVATFPAASATLLVVP
jgi:O-glycosyl hydrolase